MAARRLVLNGLTAEVRAGGGGGGGSPDSLEFYHELELFQLLAPPPRRATTPPPQRRAASPPPPRRSRTPAGARAASAGLPARYLGSTPARGAALAPQLRLLQERGVAVPVRLVVAASGVLVCDPGDQGVRMRLALRRIVFAACEPARALFALVARAPRASAGDTYCHAFETDTPRQAEELNALLGDAFRMAFASQLQPSAPLWSKEVSGERGPRAPDTLPGLAGHYPHCGNRSPAKCMSLCGRAGAASEPSPSSSESTSPSEAGGYRRLGPGPPLMRRLARALHNVSDDDSTPLVADTPTTPTNLPLCLTGGYINEASEAEARTRESNREPAALAPPVPPAPAVPPAPRRVDHLLPPDVDDDFPRCNGKNSGSGACSRTTSSSSGASSCGASLASGNNNPRAEPELRHAPWFQQGIPREIALEVLSAQPVGAFLVRGSTTQAGCHALSVRVPRDFTPGGIAHYLILRTTKGYKIKGFTKEFTSLSALVTHHSVMPELLPVPLHLPRAAPRAPRRDLADIDAVAPPPPRAPPPRPRYLAQLDV